MNNQPYIPPPEVKARLSENLRKADEQMKEVGEQLDKLIAHLDAQIAIQPQRTQPTKIREKS
jgi:hypothetical protein